jgi:SAM-dependent methyltransferase
MNQTVIWHDVECGAYDLDLPLWRELAERAAGPVLDIGCGTGRVALDLAARGYDVTGLDVDPDLVHELDERARERGLRVQTAVGDARSFDLGRRFALVLAPMQVVQLFEGPSGRGAAFAAVRRHLDPGGLFAAALANPYEGITDDEWVPPTPDIREQDGWVYASTPLNVRRDGEAAAVDRRRQTVSPVGEVSEWISSLKIDLVNADTFETEAAELGYVARERGWIPETEVWVGSTVAMLEAT